MASSIFPEMHKVLKLTSTEQPPVVETRLRPRGEPGSAIIRVLAAAVQPYSGEVYSGKRPGYNLPTPFVPGGTALGRIIEIGPDAATLSPGQLVFFDPTIRGRDSPNVIYASRQLAGITEESRKVSSHWADSTFAEFAKVLLENCLAINEPRIRQLGYKIHDLAHIFAMIVPVGGLSDINLRPGETVIITPATGKHGGAAVHVALAMGARVIAMGRNHDTLERLAALDPKRVATVCITNNVEEDYKALIAASQGLPIDACLDLSSPMAAGSTHLRSCMKALRHGGRVSLMGGLGDEVVIPYGAIVWKALMVKATWNCSHEQAESLISMVYTGALPLGETRGMTWAGKFGLDDWEEAFDTAAKHYAAGESVIITP
ncbi:hypothetical protein EDB80DRAFT_841840 [Ilyonectria destructans]|nr:hypothetical protein EDB80DRAFT_841840 [Ilyonectria destructans]